VTLNYESASQLLDPTQNGITPERYERMRLERHFSRTTAAIQNMGIGLMSTDMPLLEMHGDV